MRTLRSTNRFKRCPKCKALLRRTAELCPHCGATMPSNFPHRPPVADVLRRVRSLTDSAPPAATPEVVSQYLIIVARERRDLYDYLRRAFAREPAVLVMLERRISERRKAAAERPLERRRKDRRHRPEIDADLRRFGFAVALLD
jgi:predicted amidophosphoribosyltransferase